MKTSKNLCLALNLKTVRSFDNFLKSLKSDTQNQYKAEENTHSTGIRICVSVCRCQTHVFCVGLRPAVHLTERGKDLHLSD